MVGGHHILISLPAEASDGLARTYFSPSVDRDCPELPFQFVDALYDATRSQRGGALQRDRKMLKKMLKKLMSRGGKGKEKDSEVIARLAKRAKLDLPSEAEEEEEDRRNLDKFGGNGKAGSSRRK